MDPVISSGRMGPVHPATLSAFGSTSTVTCVTEAFGASTTGMAPRLPAVLVTLVDTQQFLPELSGSTIYHQLPSPLLPTICAEVPTFSPLRTIQPMLGPSRQLTLTSFGDATGTVGVDVVVGGGVSDGRTVCVTVAVARDSVAVDVTAAVGVSVTGALDGRLQAAKVRTRTNTNNRRDNFIATPLL
jgi:hypothetical protein